MVNIIEREIYKAKGKEGEIVNIIDQSLDIYRMNFIRNLKYVCAFIGIRDRALYRRLRYLKVRSARSKLHSIRHKTRVGFDLYIVAAFCHEFSLPIGLVLNFSLEEKGIDLTDYGLRKNQYIVDGRMNHKLNYYLQEGNQAQVAKKIRKAARDKSNNPEKIINFWMEYDNLKR